MTPSHPGDFIRTEVIEELGLNVTRAAQILGVRRATLSALLNGNAALSAEMALRIEKAFDISMDMLLRMQAWHDACCISLCFDKILQIIPMQGRGILWINSLLQERVTVASLTETYGSTGPLPGLNSLLQ